MSANRDELMSITGHVIIIEDDPVVRMLLREILAEIGFTSATFDNTVAALTHLMQIQGDCRLIIADQGLPEGVQGTGFIRMAQERWPSIPGILTSDYLVDEQVIPPTTTYLSKPYTLEQLEKTIATVLRGDRRP